MSITSIVAKFQRLISFIKKSTLAIINPKKKAHIIIGSFSKSHFIPLASDMMLTPIPAKSAIKKLPLICFQKATIPLLNKSLNACKTVEKLLE